uniref:Uncharacterized protein n=1 Tax=Candidatus Kentrum sp. FM TaxID=2126340 RepID=A0A450RWD1_9GAMM|nr:MAG: hypothetical protein BECKFM1743A_GA0114220_1000819 [Candidatus Kentron sp. FM]VFJ43873.1 MAG: hypothetical protein BECKFM1743C_GA0114222_1000421 [Candidatus Kentron sp. FM]VFK05754.1 MAG: hypothetical protein BECKFM1743B_GA0114221_1000410 [Candidatus Kentron sp. FM]
MTPQDNDGKDFDFEKIANNMPLVTVIPEDWFFSEKFFPKDGHPPDEPPKLGIAWLGKDSDTRDVEKKCGLGDPEPERYFFVGRADPEFGGMAFAYNSHIDARKGEVTPFDTGALGLRSIIPGDLAEDRIRALIEETTESLAKWRESFKGFLVAFFPDPRDYFHGRPRADADWGPSDLPARHKQLAWDKKNEFPYAWTWEARIHEPHPLLDGLLFWGAPHSTHDKLRNYLPRRDSWSSWAEPSWVERLLGTDYIDFDTIPEKSGPNNASHGSIRVFEEEIERRLWPVASV